MENIKIKFCNRIIALFLTLVMLVNTTPIGAFVAYADEEPGNTANSTPVVVEPKNAPVKYEPVASEPVAVAPVDTEATVAAPVKKTVAEKTNRITIPGAGLLLDDTFQFMQPGSIEIVFGAPFTNEAKSGDTSRTGTVSYTVSVGTDVVSVNASGKVTALKMGTATITATMPADAAYAETTITYGITIIGKPQTDFEISGLPTAAVYNESNNNYTLSTTGGQGGGAVTYGINVSSPAGAAEIDNTTGVLTILKAGSITVDATIASDGEYAETTVAATIEVAKAERTLAFDEPIANEVYYGMSFSKEATQLDKASNDNGTIAYSIAGGADIVSISNTGALTFNSQKVGTVTVQAKIEEDDCFEEATNSYTVAVKYLEEPTNKVVMESEEKPSKTGWYKGDVKIKAPAGYTISASNDLSGNTWADAVVVDTEGVAAKSVYLKNAVGAITDRIVIAENTIRIDKTAPASLEIAYSESVIGKVIEKITFGYYKADLTVTLMAEDTLSGVDSFCWKYEKQQGASEQNKENESAIITADKIEYSNDGKTATATFKLPSEVGAQYRGNISVTATDRAGNKNSIDDATVIVLDDIAPTRTIEYSTAKQVTNRSGTEQKDDYDYTKEDTGSTLHYGADTDMNLTGMTLTFWITEANFYPEDVLIKVNGENNDSVTWAPGEEADQWTGILALTADGNYTVTMEYTDRSGNEMTTFTSEQIIVDTTAPTRVVEYSDASQVVDKDTLNTQTGFDVTSEDTNSILYYGAGKPMTLTFTVIEANFFAQDVVVEVNGQPYSPTDWAQTEGTDEWAGSIELEGDDDYIVTMEYTDRSDNEMDQYTSEQITIDTIAPVVDVVYSPDNVAQTLGGRKYYGVAQKATITITEHNFRGDDVVAVVTAVDSAGNTVSVQNYAEYLKNRDNWTSDRDVHTATIEYSADANYTFDISYLDLALNQAEDYTQDLFTIDTVSPQNLDISYSVSLFECVLESLTFGFYNAQMTVTITAEDVTSGVYGFVYSYKKGPGVSGINAELIDQAISNADITYSNEGKTATAEFKIPKMVLQSDNQFNGTVEFTATDRTKHTADKSDIRRIVVDNIPPTALVRYNEPVQMANDIWYYDGDIQASVVINEANFYAEDVKVFIAKDGASRYEVSPAWTHESVDTHTGTFTISGDGDYIVEIAYQDRSTNEMQAYKSNQLTIDQTAPTISVTGLKHESANKDETIGFVVTVEDANMQATSFVPVLEAVIKMNDGRFETADVSKLGTVAAALQGEKYVYTVQNLEEDAIYSLRCSVGDMARNSTADMEIIDSKQSVDTMLFSVNRNGSTYSVSEATNELHGSFTREPIDVVVYEINTDKLEDIKITLFKNDKTIVSKQGIDYSVTQTGGNGSWYKYEYTIFKSNFEDDGIYRITTHSTDAAGNVSENTLDTKMTEISFGIDKTKPNVIVTNLEKGVTYPVENLEVVMTVNDNLKLTAVSVLLDGKEHKNWNPEDIQTIAEQKGDFVFDVNGDSLKSHTVKIVCLDAAGNKTIVEIENFFVTTNMWVRYYTNKPLFFGSIASVLLLATGIVVLIKAKKKKVQSAQKEPTHTF